MPKREPKLVLHLELDPTAFNPSALTESLSLYREHCDPEARLVDLLTDDEVIVDDDQIVVSFRMGDGDNRPVQFVTTARLVGAEIKPTPTGEERDR